MIRIAILIVLASLQGCVPTRNIYYLPTDDEFKYEDRHCGVPSGGYYNAITDDVRISINATVEEGDLWIGFQFILLEDHSLRFKSKTLKLLDQTGEVRETEISPSSGHGLPSLDPTRRMQGAPPDSFFANVKVPGFAPTLFVLRLPIIVADDKDVEVQPIEFLLQKKTGLLYCVQ